MAATCRGDRFPSRLRAARCLPRGAGHLVARAAGRLSPNNQIAKAIAYSLNAWDALVRFLDDGRMCLTNNAAERALHCIAVGRNNWTFVGSDRGGKTMAVLRSFVASCELAKVDPFAWYQDVLTRIGECSIQQLDELLPHRWATARA